MTKKSKKISCILKLAWYNVDIRVRDKEREKRMFEIGDRVIVDCDVVGRIIGWRYDEGNVWAVQITNGDIIECADDYLSPAK